MKRSKAIQIIADFLADPETLHNSQLIQEGKPEGTIGVELQAKICLQHLEEEGMLPPSIGVGESDEYGYLEYVNKWESEDVD